MNTISNKIFNEVIKEAYKELKIDDTNFSFEPTSEIEEKLEQENIFIAEDRYTKHQKLSDEMKKNRKEYNYLNKVRAGYTKELIDMREMRDSLKLKKADLIHQITELEREGNSLYTIYHGIVGRDYNTKALAFMLEYCADKYAALKIGEEYTVTSVKKGVDKSKVVDLLDKINKLENEKKEIDSQLAKVRKLISDRSFEENRIKEQMIMLDFKYRDLADAFRKGCIRKNIIPTDIYIDAIDFGKTLKDCFGVNGTGIIKGIKIC